MLIDVAGKTSIADAMIIATGRSNTHVAAIADRVARLVKTSGAGAPRVEGLASSEWVLIDAGDAIVHVFKPETRLFYNLEKLWGDDRPGEGKPPTPAPKKVRAAKPAAAGPIKIAAKRAPAKAGAKKAPVKPRAAAKPKKKV